MYRSGVAGLDCRSRHIAAGAGAGAQVSARCMLPVSRALAIAGLAMVASFGGGLGALGALRASEMPRFIARQQLLPLQEALLAYTAQATASDATPRPAFGAPVSNRNPGAGMPRELEGAPERITFSSDQATTSEFQSTLNAARWDTGEARALADEMSRRATEIGDRLSLSGIGTLTQAPHTQLSDQDTHARLDFKAPAVMRIVEPSGEATAVAAATSDAASAAAIVVLGKHARQALAVPAETSDQPSRPAPPPLPGLMSLGGAKKEETASVGPEEAGGPAVGITTQAGSEHNGGSPTRASGKSVANPPAVHPVPGIAQPQETGKPMSAAAASGFFVPLSPPKDRAAKHGGPEPISTTPHPAQDASGGVVKSAPASPKPRSASQPAPSSARAPATSTPAGQPSTAAAQLGAGGADDKNKEQKGFFSWFKPLGKPLEMPREIRSSGWANE